MVIQRTIENLRDRPRHERKSVAMAAAFGVMGVLFFGWIIYFVRSVQTQTIALPTQQAAEAVQQVKDTYGNAVQSASAQASQSDVAQPDSSAQIIDLPNDTTHF